MTFKRVLAAVSLGAAASGAAHAADSGDVILHTSAGAITLSLDSGAAPLSVENFLAYARDGHYDGTIFHRVIPGFMIQGGGMEPDMGSRPTREPIANEAGNGLTNARGSVAMARTSAPDSATSQFFINLKDNAFLEPGGVDPHGYAVFGRVISGMEVVDSIAAVETTRRAGHADVPVGPVIIERVEVVAAAE